MALKNVAKSYLNDLREESDTFFAAVSALGKS